MGNIHGQQDLKFYFQEKIIFGQLILHMITAFPQDLVQYP